MIQTLVNHSSFSDVRLFWFVYANLTSVWHSGACFARAGHGNVGGGGGDAAARTVLGGSEDA
jgi:hypothetical protein